MEFFQRKKNHTTAAHIRFADSELRRLSQCERDLDARLASTCSAREAATSAREAVLNETAISAAEDRVRTAEGVVRKLEDALASVRSDREAAPRNLEAARDQARRLDEAATVTLVICEIVDAVKAFERATDRLASALDGARGRAAHEAPLVAASLRLSKTSFATEAGAVIREIEVYRAGLLDGSVKLKESVVPQPSSIGSAAAGAHQFIASEPTLSIVPPAIPAPATR